MPFCTAALLILTGFALAAAAIFATEAPAGSVLAVRIKHYDPLP